MGPVASNCTDPVERRVNVAVVRGVCPDGVEVRRLDSGAALATLSVRTCGPAGRATSVPVAVWDPPAWLEDLGPGAELVVVGLVHRRFFRGASGAPGARVELEATAVAPGGDRRRVGAALRRAEQLLAVLA